MPHDAAGSPPEAFDLPTAIRDERLRLCSLAEDLDDTEWRSDSLCAAWTVRDVVAHLTLTTREGWWDMLKGAIAARGDFDRMTAASARRHAERCSPTELIAQLRQSAEETRRTPMSSRLDPLADLLVHGQDIARPLGRSLTMSPDRTLPALTHVLTSRWYGAAKRFAGLRLVATDVEWSHGDSVEVVSGASGDLLLVATGRTSATALLTGDGLRVLSTRLDRSAASGRAGSSS